MKKKLLHENYGRSNLGWLQSLFHFSFAEYQNPDNIHYGVLRVLNDDLVAAGTGFDLHPHRDMEIVSYVIDGELTHGDNMGHEETLTRGQVQYMSAGTGILHSEYNHGAQTARFLQIWILPDRRGHQPAYGDFRFAWEDRVNRLLPLVGPKTGTAPVKINQDAWFYASYLEAGHELEFAIQPGRKVYLITIEGELNVSGESLRARDALEAKSEVLKFTTPSSAHFLFIEMAEY